MIPGHLCRLDTIIADNGIGIAIYRTFEHQHATEYVDAIGLVHSTDVILLVGNVPNTVYGCIIARGVVGYLPLGFLRELAS